MVFSSVSFLFFFLPLLLLCYYLTPKKWRNYVLLIFNIFFYFWGEKWYVFLLLATCVINYFLGLLINKKHSKIYLIIGLVINLALLIYFKYTNFFLNTFSIVFPIDFPIFQIILPLGISFFTYQNLTYLIDVYRKDVMPATNIFKYTLYITLFPQLIAGPIIRYQNVAQEIENREESITLFGKGVERFIIGLAKKILIADSLYFLANNLLNSQMSSLTYIIVAISYTLQIYYDFSGYSDMAIGLGKMFGFNFSENFNYPLWAISITDFWRQWHISLSSFFKDYVYIPLGGNRCSFLKHIRNLLIVWFLTGLWHGASWNFIIWGIYYFIFLIFEKFILKNRLTNKFLAHIYTLSIVIISFIIFNTNNIEELITFFKGLLGVGYSFTNFECLHYLKNNYIILIIAFLGISPFLKNKIKILEKGKMYKLFAIGECLWLILLFLLVIASTISSTFQQIGRAHF